MLTFLRRQFAYISSGIDKSNKLKSMQIVHFVLSGLQWGYFLHWGQFNGLDWM